MAQSSICDFYNGRNIFVTGGLGFLGKVLIEKLLRSTDVATIYVLIRDKKGKNAQTRFDEMFDNILFDKLKIEKPCFKDRVVAIQGDCMSEDLSLSSTDKAKLVLNVNIVFHGAATVNFNENLKFAYSVNVNGTANVIEFCRQMKELQSLVHVSTAYSNCHLNSIDEKFYKYPMSYEKVASLLGKLSENEALKLTPEIIGKWPNTYTFTKALAESLIRNTAGGLPIGIFRPSIVISTYREPIEGWTDNLYGPAGAVLSIASGLLRVCPFEEDVVADVVPIDTCVAGIIAAAWDVAEKSPSRQEISSPNIPLYNYVSSVENSLTWGEILLLNKRHFENCPLQKTMWTPKVLSATNGWTYFLMKLFLHLIPASILDTFCVITGQKPQFVSTYRKIHKFTEMLLHFSTHEWTFTNDNVVALWEKMNKNDRTLFPLSMTKVLWTTYFRNYFKGIRVYLMGDPLSTLDAARSRKKKFDIAHNFIKFLGIFLFGNLMWSCVSKVAILVVRFSSFLKFLAHLLHG